LMVYSKIICSRFFIFFVAIYKKNRKKTKKILKSGKINIFASSKKGEVAQVVRASDS
jgi:hypothetical protein